MHFSRLSRLFLAAALFSPSLVLAAASAEAPPKPVRVLLIAGGCCHDYAAQRDLLKAGLEARARIEMDVIYTDSRSMTHIFEELNKPGWAQGYDVILHNQCTANTRDMAVIESVLAPHKLGLPAVFIHCAMHTFRTEGWNTQPPAVTPWFEFTGLQTTGHGAQQPITLSWVDGEHPIVRGLIPWTTGNEELYNNPGGIFSTSKPVIRGRQGTNETVVAWTSLYKEKAKTFGITLGHNTPTIGDPRFLDVIARGILWSVDKLNDTYLKPPPVSSTAAPSALLAPTNASTAPSANPSPVPR